MMKGVTMKIRPLSDRLLVERLDLKGEEELGKKIILHALEEPIRQIADNAGHEGSVVANTVKSFAGAKGFNADT
jgi:chaperonin GroEL